MLVLKLIRKRHGLIENLELLTVKVRIGDF